MVDGYAICCHSEPLRGICFSVLPLPFLLFNRVQASSSRSFAANQVFAFVVALAFSAIACCLLPMALSAVTCPL